MNYFENLIVGTYNEQRIMVAMREITAMYTENPSNNGICRVIIHTKTRPVSDPFRITTTVEVAQEVLASYERWTQGLANLPVSQAAMAEQTLQQFENLVKAATDSINAAISIHKDSMDKLLHLTAKDMFQAVNQNMEVLTTAVNTSNELMKDMNRNCNGVLQLSKAMDAVLNGTAHMDVE